MKIGRNDPCTCGSGLKYKKCCAAKDEAARSAELAAQAATREAAAAAADAEAEAEEQEKGKPQATGTRGSGPRFAGDTGPRASVAFTRPARQRKV